MAMNDPQNPGSVLQLIDPIAMPQQVKVKRRWPVLFSFGR